MKNLPNEYFITELDEMIFESSVQKALVDVAETLKQKNSLWELKGPKNTGKRKSHKKLTRDRNLL